MADLDESFRLLSTMSPRHTNKKVPAMKITKLTLKKQIRHSSIYSKLPPSENVVVMDSESTETVSSSEYSCDVNEPIVISDSCSSDGDVVNKNGNVTPLSSSKYRAISKWVTKVNVEQTNCKRSDEPRKKFEATNLAIDSPVLFKKDYFRSKEFLNESGASGYEIDEFVKNESLTTRMKKKNSLEDESGGANKFITMRKKDACYFDLPKIIDDSFGPDLRNGANKVDECNEVDVEKTPKNYVNHDAEKVLDELYGNSWRINREKVLSNPEPKLRKTAKPKFQQPKTELKLKNPYLESEQKKSSTLLRNLQSARLKQMIESPMIKSLKNLCDSESSSDDDEASIPRTKLNFDESDDDDGKIAVNKKPTKKKNTRRNKPVDNSDKENCSVSSGDETSDDDEKSNRKTKPTSRIKFIASSSSSFNDSSNSNGIIDSKRKNDARVTQDNKKLNPASFLASLSQSVPAAKCDNSAKVFRECYKTCKDDLARKLFALYNEKIFDNAIPSSTPLEWNDRMRGSAGFCHCRKITHRTGVVERAVRISLSTKVLDSADRLRDTLVHEMCHAATWVVNEVGDGHGQFWKAWAHKAMKTFPELPPIKRCHDYVINTKFTYKCTSCGYCIGRHSKSLDTTRKRCGYCYGTFELLINKKTKNGLQSVAVTPKKEATGFALFVKQNYASVKTPAHSHADVMKELSKKFSQNKISTN